MAGVSARTMDGNEEGNQKKEKLGHRRIDVQGEVSYYTLILFVSFLIEVLYSLSKGQMEVGSSNLFTGLVQESSYECSYGSDTIGNRQFDWKSRVNCQKRSSSTRL